MKPTDQLTDKEKAMRRKRQLQELHEKAATAEPEVEKEEEKEKVGSSGKEQLEHSAGQ